jgi:hypothetical protein
VPAKKKARVPKADGLRSPRDALKGLQAGEGGHADNGDGFQVSAQWCGRFLSAIRRLWRPFVTAI